MNKIDVLFTLYRARDDFILHCLKAGNINRQCLPLHNIKLYAKMIDVQQTLNATIYGGTGKTKSNICSPQD